MEYVILGLLLLQPNTLYGIHKAFEQGISMFYSSSLGSLQSAVKRLESKGYIYVMASVENGRAKKNMAPTPEGQAAFFAWLNAPLAQQNLEVELLSRLYFLGLIPQISDQIQCLRQWREDIEKSRGLLIETNTQLDQLEIPEVYQGIFYYQRKVLGYGIDTHGYGLEWLERLIAERIEAMATIASEPIKEKS